MLWQLGGGNADLLPLCPSDERAKFLLIGITNTILTLLVASVTTAVAREWLSRQLLPPTASELFLSVGTPLVWLFTFVLVLLLLISSVRMLTTREAAVRRSAGPILSFRLRFNRFPMAAYPGTAIAASISYAVVHVLLGRAPASTFYVFFGLFLAMFLSPIIIASMWSSPVYDRLRSDAASSRQSKSGDTATAELSHEPLQSEVASSEDVRLENELAELFERQPDNVPIAQRLIDLRRKLGRQKDALPVYDRLLSADPQNVSLIRGKANLYREMGDEDKYRKTQEKADLLLARASFEENLGKDILVREFAMEGLDFFGDYKWPLQSRVNILLGKNGYGKTYLLRAFVSMLQNDDLLTQFFGNAGPKAKIQVDAEKEGQPLSIVRTPLLFEQSFGKIPVLAIPDIRYVDKAKSTLGTTPDEVTDLRSQGAWHFLNEESYEGLIVNFLYDLCLDYNHGRSFELPLFRLVESSVSKLSNGTFKFHEIRRRDNARFEIFVETEGNESRPLPLQKASQGTLSIVAMVGMTYRYLRAVYASVPEEEVTQQRAIVVIDEIDAHLHPSWQRKILPLFRDTFPNIQFIVTAHSPLVVAGAKENEVAVLRRKPDGFTVEVLPQHFIGATSEEMYRRVFEVEETDETYLRLGTLHANKASLEKEAAGLESKGSRTTQERARLEDLKDDLYYLREFEEVRAEKEKLDQLDTRNRALERESMQLQGKVEELKGELARYTVTATDLVGVHQVFDRLLKTEANTAETVEAFARFLADLGQHEYSAAALESLSRLHPNNLTYLKELAVAYQNLGRYDQALGSLEGALKIKPDDAKLRDSIESVKRIVGTVAPMAGEG